MWHEARRHEKKIRVMIVDYRKRAERRREFYEKFKADPTQFMQVHGRPIKIHMDPAITNAAEKCLMPWQGNPETTIDRFDVRAHLDYIPEPNSYSKAEVVDDPSEQASLNYERYRILIQNDLAGISEDKFLHQIHIEEQFGTTVSLAGNKSEAKSKQQPGAAIAYTYDDSTPNASSLSSTLQKSGTAADLAAAAEEDSDEDLDFDMLVNVNDMTPAQKADLNNSGTKYGLAPGDFMNFLNAEIQEKEDIRLAKLQEEEKQAMSGRKARRERRAYKDRIIMRKGYISPPSYAATNSPSSDRSHRSSSRSRSRSNSPEKIEYITSFGESNPNEKRMIPPSTFGPCLPPGGFTFSPRKRAKSRSRSRTPNKLRVLSKSPVPAKHKMGRNRSSSSSASSRSNSNGRTRSQRSSSSFSNSRSRSRSRRSRSRSRSRRKRRSNSLTSNNRRDQHSTRGRRRSKSNSRGRNISRRWSRTRSSRSRSRSRSKSRAEYKRRNHPPDRGNDPWDGSRSRKAKHSKLITLRKSESRSPSRSFSDSEHSRRDTRDEDLKSDSRNPSSPVKLPSPPRKRYYGRDKSTKKESSDSMSSSEDGAKLSPIKSTGVGERSTRITGSGMKSKSSVSSSTKVPGSSTGSGSSSRISQGVKPQDRLKRRMQSALNRQLKADKEAQKSRMERQEQERLEREESLRELSIKYRRRERERRHRSGRDSRSGSTSSEGSSRSGSSGTDGSGTNICEF